MTESIVLSVCKELRVHPTEFFGSGRDQRLSKARRIAIERLRAEGFSMRGISRMVRRSYSTVQYWLHPEYRKRRTEYFRGLRVRKGMPKTERRWLLKEQKDYLLSVYLKHGFAAAKPIAIGYKISPRNISYYSRAAGIKGKPGRPEARA